MKTQIENALAAALAEIIEDDLGEEDQDLQLETLTSVFEHLNTTPGLPNLSWTRIQMVASEQA